MEQYDKNQIHAAYYELVRNFKEPLPIKSYTHFGKSKPVELREVNAEDVVKYIDDLTIYISSLKTTILPFIVPLDLSNLYIKNDLFFNHLNPIILNQNISFLNTVFADNFYCQNIKFKSLNIDFTNTEFNGNAKFSNIEFLKGEFYCEDAYFKEMADFQYTQFQIAKFNKSKFLDSVNFNNAEFKNTTDFTGCIFDKPPTFHGALLHKDTTFMNTKVGLYEQEINITFKKLLLAPIYFFFLIIKTIILFVYNNIIKQLFKRPYMKMYNFTDKNFKEIDDDIRAYRTIKEIMNTNKAYMEEYRFFYLEQYAHLKLDIMKFCNFFIKPINTLQLKDLKAFSYLPNIIFAFFYEIISKSGQSTSRPILWWLAILGSFGLVFNSANLVEANDIKWSHDKYLGFWYSLQSISNPFSLFNTDIPFYPKTNWVAFLAHTESILGVIIITLWIFALKRRFQKGE